MRAAWAVAGAGLVIWAAGVSGADVSVILDSSDGSSRFGVYNAQTVQLARVASDGVATFSNEVQVVRAVPGAMGSRLAVSVGGGEDVQEGESADGYFMGTAVGAYADGAEMGTAVGHSAEGAGNGTAVGMMALGHGSGAAVGREASGTNFGVAVGMEALGADYGTAVGNQANGGEGGVAIGYAARGFGAVAVGRQSDATQNGTALGYQAFATNDGVAAGLNARGNNQSVGLGRAAHAATQSVAAGYSATARENGVAVGWRAAGHTNSAALGHAATGRWSAVAMGGSALALTGGVAVGSSTMATRYGVAIGNSARASVSNIAIGVGAVATNSPDYLLGPRVAIGPLVNNDIDGTTRLRGNLFLEESDGFIRYRAALGSGTWSTKAFTIPHPLDPENKVLRHFCLEGPEVWNVYAGNAQLAEGAATVELPDYYAALNEEGSEVVSLTPWGAASVWVAGVEGRELRIGGDRDVKVSWEVKVRRNDPAVREDLRRRPVEQLRGELVLGQMERENLSVDTGR